MMQIVMTVGLFLLFATTLFSIFVNIEAMTALCGRKAPTDSGAFVRSQFSVFPLSRRSLKSTYDEGAGLLLENEKSSFVSMPEEVEKMSAYYQLTARETEVLVLLLKGYNNARIAHDLVLSDSTVKSHIYNVYRKLGVHSRQAIIDLFEMHVKNEGLHVVFQRNAR